jgi:hypothetical protein
MGNIFGSPEKVSRKARLFRIATEALGEQGWNVERVPLGKSSVRKISRNGESKLVSIRTTQDTWIAFPRSNDNKSWVTLGEVDAVVAVSVDHWENPKFAKVHMIDGAEMRNRFDRAYKARLAAGHSISVGQGVWVPLYVEEDSTPSNVGGGAGIANPPFKVVPLDEKTSPAAAIKESPEVVQLSNEPPFTIQEAKRRLAMTLGIDPSHIKISIDA